MNNTNWLKYYNLIILDETDSTNNEAKKLAANNPSGNFVISTQHQTNGRGRYGKSWESLEGNLYFSILLDSETFITKQTDLSFVSALSVYNAIRVTRLYSKLDFDISLKWPNDVLIDGAKVSGILLESVRVHNRQKLIIGIGINVLASPNLDTQYQTTSIFKSTQKHYTTSYILNIVMSSFMHYYKLWETKGFLYIRHLWLKKAYHQDKMILVNDGTNKISGIFQDVDTHGAMRIKLASGEIHTISVGEIFFIE